MLGGGDHVRLGRVGHHDPAPGGRLDVHVVHPDTGRPTACRRSACASRSAVELGGGADEDAVEVADAPLEFAVLPVDAQLDLEAGVAQQLDSGVPDLLLDQDFGRRRSRRRAGRHAGLPEYALGGADAGAQLHLVSQLGQRHLEPGDRGEDVERAEVATVGDAADLALELCPGHRRS